MINLAKGEFKNIQCYAEVCELAKGEFKNIQCYVEVYELSVVYNIHCISYRMISLTNSDHRENYIIIIMQWNGTEGSTKCDGESLH